MIHIIAVSFFGSTQTDTLLRSVEQQSSRDWRITLVDNSESSEEALRLGSTLERCSQAALVVASRNFGYLGGARLAGHRLSTDDTWTVICNTDIEFRDPEALARLEKLPPTGIGVVAPSVVSARTGRDQNPYMHQRPSLRVQQRRRRQLASPLLAQASLLLSAAVQRAPASRRPRPSTSGAVPLAPLPREIYAAHGSVFALSSDYFARGGDLLHPLFLFGEELFFAEKCRELHLSVVYVPEIQVLHLEHAQTHLFRSRPVLRSMVEAGRFGVNHLYPEF